MRPLRRSDRIRSRLVAREVLHLEHRADLAVALLAVATRSIDRHEPLGPLDRLLLRLRLDDRVARDQLLRLRERAVDHGALLAAVLDAGALRAGPQPFARQDHAGLLALLEERPHGGEQLLVREDARFRVL